MMKIKNFNELAVSDLRKAALTIAEAGLQAIDTKKVIRNVISLDGDAIKIGSEVFKTHEIGRIVVGGIGKCALDAAHAIEEILGERISSGVVLHIEGEPMLKRIEAIRGTHPLPSEKNIRGAAAIVGSLNDLRENDLVIFVVSGGGSTLLCLPQDVGCEEEASIMQTLIHAGATIREINTVRKHLSIARGGYLAKYAYPAHLISLIFSDVPGDDLQFIASGPTVKDTTTVYEAQEILAKYDILNKCGIEKCGLVETPKEDKYFEKTVAIVAVSNHTALQAMEEEARTLGFEPRVCNACLEGEARDVALAIVEELRKAPKNTALLYGGETTVTVSGHGRGGRNLELTLSALRKINEHELLVSVASDGRDNGPFAGAICDTITKKSADLKNVDIKVHLDENNEYPFFEEIGHYLMTEDTGSNVSDLVIAIKF